MWESLMDKRVSVQRSTVGKDAGGGATRTFATIASNVQASIQSASSRDVDLYSRRNLVIDHTIYCVFDFDTKISGGLKLGDNIVDANGIVYVVRGVQKDQNSAISTQPLYQIAAQRIIN